MEEPAYEQPNYSPDFNTMVEVAESPSMSKRFHFEEDPSKGKRHCTEIEDEYDAIGSYADIVILLFFIQLTHLF